MKMSNETATVISNLTFSGSFIILILYLMHNIEKVYFEYCISVLRKNDVKYGKVYVCINLCKLR